MKTGSKFWACMVGIAAVTGALLVGKFTAEFGGCVSVMVVSFITGNAFITGKALANGKDASIA